MEAGEPLSPPHFSELRNNGFPNSRLGEMWPELPARRAMIHRHGTPQKSGRVFNLALPNTMYQTTMK